MKVMLSFLFAAILMPATVTYAQSDRAESWELGVTLLDLSSVGIQGTNGASLDVSGSVGYGFSGLYNFNERFAAGLDLTYSDPKYVATRIPDGMGNPEVIRARLGVDVIHFKGVFNFLDSDITPFVEVGGGWTYVDSNIISGYGGSLCWWDPWWGYVCRPYYDTYSETRTSYSYGVGIRWDINSDFSFRASWGEMEIDTNSSSEDIELESILATFSWRF